MVRYIARPPVAMDRLAIRNDGLITYRLKKKYRDGTEQLTDNYISKTCFHSDHQLQRVSL
ncbi:MAG: hypothetical protein FJ116_12485 [Deltaproteobacteria bacterium]|nr:hypothetical protein [Deltaproteobacteria bacterium]